MPPAVAEFVDQYPAAASYLETCFVLVTDHGLEISQLIPNGDDVPVTQVYRNELPRGPVGDEMWERLTTGLRLRRWDHHNQKVVAM